MTRNMLVAAAGAMVMFAAAARGQVVNANECVNATVISGTGTFSFDTRTATRSTQPPAFQGSVTMNYDVWARWTAPQTGWLTLSTCAGGTTSGVVTIYQGADCAALTPWAVGASSICGGHVAAFWVNQGDTYTFRLDLPRRLGQFSLAYGTAFPGDDCHNALTVSGTGIFPFDNSGATSQYLASDPYQYVQNDVWYRWTAPQGGPTYIHTCGVMVFASAALSLYDDACPVLENELAFSVNAPGCGGARIDFVADAGRTYLIRLGSTSSGGRLSNGAFEIVQTGGGGGGGETIVVTTAYDIVDFTGAQNVASLPGPDGHVSFREACIAANNTAGPQRIEFNVPQSEWYYPITTFPYATLINASGSAFMLTDDGTVIDGATQTTNVGDTNPNGPDVGFWSWNPNAGGSPNIIITGNDCVLKDLQGAGLMGSAAWINGDNNRVIGCRLVQGLQDNLRVRGDNNVVGGTEPGEANIIEGLLIEQGAQDTLVVGNRLVGVSLQAAVDTRIGGPSVAERNIIGGSGRFCCEGFPTGAQVSIGGATGTILENNYIGVAADGVTIISQVGPTGVSISGSTGTLVRNNVISECQTTGQNHYAGQLFGVGVSISGTCVDTVVQGNLIGTDATGQNPVVNLVGVHVTETFQNPVTPLGTLIGGEGPGEGNLIAFSTRQGLVVAPAVSGVRVVGNRFRDNGQLGIDLGEDGVTANDAGDFDGGANNRQNFPVLSSAGVEPGGVRVAGTLNSNPGRAFRLEFFASPACDASGHGEGHEFLGATTVTTDGSGNAAFNAVLDATAMIGWVATATATDLTTGDTSEFSACETIAEGGSGCAADFDGSGTVAVPDIFAFLAAWFAGSTSADFDGNGLVQVPDIFAYLSAWFAGC